MPDRDYYLVDDPKFAEARTKYVAHVATMLQLAGLARSAGARRSASSTSRSRSPRRTGPGPSSRQVDKAYNPVADRRARHADARLRLERASCRAAASANTPRSSSPSRPRSPAPPSSSRRRRSRRGASIWPIHTIVECGAAPVEGVRRRELRLLRHDALGHARSSRSAGSAASTWSTARSARPSASSTSQRYFPPETKAKADELVQESDRRDGRPPVQARLDGARDQGQGARQARRLHPQDRLSRQVARLFGAARS